MTRSNCSALHTVQIKNNFTALCAWATFQLLIGKNFTSIAASVVLTDPEFEHGSTASAETILVGESKFQFINTINSKFQKLVNWNIKSERFE